MNPHLYKTKIKTAVLRGVFATAGLLWAFLGLVFVGLIDAGLLFRGHPKGCQEFWSST